MPAHSHRTARALALTCCLCAPVVSYAQITAEQAPLPQTKHLTVEAEQAPLPQTHQLTVESHPAPLPGEAEAKMRPLLIVAEREHSDSDFAYNMLQAMYDKAKTVKPTLSKRDFILAFHDKAVNGDAEAGYYYGAARLSGFGVATGPDKEVEGYLAGGVKLGKLEAFRDYATVYSQAEPPDLAKAYALVKKAADGGLPSGKAFLGEFLQAGTGGAEKSSIDALMLFKEAADAGDAVGAFHTGLMLGQEEKRPDAAVVHYFQIAAAGGDDRALCFLGMDLIRGRGIAKDEKTGTDYLTAAASQGNTLAQRMLGVYYLNGSHGLTQNDTAGRLYTESAAINGDDDAQIDYAIMLMDGTWGAKQDHDTGMAYMMKAAKTNDRAQKVMHDRAVGR